MCCSKKPNDFRIKAPDNDGNVVERIYLKSMEYVVYRTQNAIRIDLDDDNPNTATYIDNHHKLGVILARIYSWLPENLSWSEPINRQIARAIAVNAKGKQDEAIEMLNHAEERILNLKTLQGKLQYTASSFAIVGLALLTLIVFYENGASGYALYSGVAFCGALGGVLSVAVGYSSLTIDIDANAATNCMIGASRILIAMSAALFLYFAIASGVLLSFIGKMDSNDGIFFVSMIAGFCEMLVPSIMSNLSEKIGNDKLSKPKGDEAA